ncbi:Zinc finger protein 541 [Frankliniella fusca]|uniref:Zinc finger protein 541 n=1 Tax=Frankliniella fusca TaxID=407009 RepID=A0AAE1HPB4_9NEOP|nr:Zinc finger protein 541 [Frankliniella fusca]
MEKSDSEELSEEEFQPKLKVMKPTSSNVKPSTEQRVLKPSEIKCQFCSKVFSSSHNLSRHRLCCKQNPHKSSNISKFVCEVCSKTFSRSDHFNAHKKKPCSMTTKSEARTKCLHPKCEESFYHKSSLLEHLKCVHHDEIKEPISLQFSSVKDFVVWKDKEEEKTYSYFSQQGGKAKKRGTAYLYCQYDGSSKLHLKDGMSRKTKRKKHCGSIKTGNLCLAMMKVYRKSDNEISVVYYPSHTHPLDPTDFQRQPLSKATYDLIDQQLAWDVSPLKIKKNLENGAFERSNRENGDDVFRKNDFVSIKLIRERKRRKRYAKRLHKCDANSVKLLYESLKKEAHNPLLIYKPYLGKVLEGTPEAEEIPPDDLFMFGFQTKQQEELLKKGCSKILLIDETHGTNQYENYQLLTVMVPDDNNRCWPVAHLITSCSEATYVQFFFLSIKARCPDLDINCIMTDDAPNLINSVDLAWGKNHRHLLCLWHIDQIFQKNIHLQGVPRSLDSEI